jgi:hypothetical protein
MKDRVVGDARAVPANWASPAYGGDWLDARQRVAALAGR